MLFLCSLTFTGQSLSYADQAILFSTESNLGTARYMGLSGAFGGGMAGGLLGSKTGDFLTWVTIVMVGVFLTLAVVLAKWYKPSGGSQYLPQGGSQQNQPVPPTTPGDNTPPVGPAQPLDAGSPIGARPAPIDTGGMTPATTDVNASDG